MPKPKAGFCRVCHCTEEHACGAGCHWVDGSRTPLCSMCYAIARGVASKIIGEVYWQGAPTRARVLSLFEVATLTAMGDLRRRSASPPRTALQIKTDKAAARARRG